MRVVVAGAVGLASLLAAAPAVLAEEDYDPDAHTMRQFYVGLGGGIAIVTEYDEARDKTSGVPAKLLGGNIGITASVGETGSFNVDGLAMPVGGLYVAQGSYLHGLIRWDADYTEPCSAPTGYTCSRTFPGRKVRNVLGLKGGARVTFDTDGDVSPMIEAGFGLRGQFGIELSYLFDVAAAASGGAMDLYMQFRAFYFSMNMFGIASYDAATPFVAMFNIGYATGAW